MSKRYQERQFIDGFNAAEDQRQGISSLEARNHKVTITDGQCLDLARKPELTVAEWTELTGIGRGVFGMYDISADAVRFRRWTDEEIRKSPSSEQPDMERENTSEALRFPCTPCALVAFIDSADIGGRHFDVPDAFREAATTQAVAESSEQPDMVREGQTIDTSSGATTNAEGEPTKTRKDDMRLAIEEIVREIAKKGERVTAVSVMAKLKAGAGKGGCVLDVPINGNGVLWERGDGTGETMNMKRLEARLYRMRKSPR